MDQGTDGIYAGYMTGASGNGFAMFVFLRGVLSGADPLGVLFDGTYSSVDDGFAATVKVTVPADMTVVQGGSAGPAGMSYTVDFQLARDFSQRDYNRIETPLGPVNLRLKKLRDLRASA